MSSGLIVIHTRLISRGLLYWHGLTLINNFIIKWGIKLLIHSQTPAVQPLKLRIGQAISSHTFLGMRLLIHAGIKLTHVSKMDPSSDIMSKSAWTESGEVRPNILFKRKQDPFLGRFQRWNTIHLDFTLGSER